MSTKVLLKCTGLSQSVHFFLPSTLKKHPQNHALYDAFFVFFVVFLVSHIGPGNSQNVKKHKINVKNIKKTCFFQESTGPLFFVFLSYFRDSDRTDNKKKSFFLHFFPPISMRFGHFFLLYFHIKSKTDYYEASTIL